MTDRYYSVKYDELYYIFDSEKISKKELEKELEYDLCSLGDSLTDNEILELLNQLAEMKEVGLRNITCLNCASLYNTDDGEKKRKQCKKKNDNEMNTVLICNEWRKKK